MATQSVATPHGELVLRHRRMLGLDLSLTATGVAVVDDTGYHSVGLIRTDDKMPMGERLSYIRWQISDAAGVADLAVVERPFIAAHGISPAMVFGVVVAELWQRKVPIVEVPPTSLKVFATGAGRTPGGQAKLGTFATAIRRLGYEGQDDNEADALWLATLGWHLIGQPVVELPQTHTRTLEGPWAEGWPGFTGIPKAPKTRRKKAS